MDTSFIIAICLIALGVVLEYVKYIFLNDKSKTFTVFVDVLSMGMVIAGFGLLLFIAFMFVVIQNTI